MHALHITFRSTRNSENVASMFADYAQALKHVPGLQTKTWIATGSTFGGFHIFDDQQSAEDYLASELAQGLVGTEGFTDFEITHYAVLADLSAVTGIEERRALAAT